MGIFLAIVLLVMSISIMRSRLGLIQTIIFIPIALGIAVLFSVELLSLFESLETQKILFSSLFIAVLFSFFFRDAWKGAKSLGSDFVVFFRTIWGTNNQSMLLISRISCLFVAITLTLSLLQALVSAPNNWDSMTYHLPRVVHWLQNHNVDFYDSITSRQLTMPPLGEYFVLLSFAFAGGNDLLANSVQYLFLIFDLAIISSISWIISKNPVALRFSLIIAASTPIALAEASTTQVDLIASTWVLTGVASVFAFTQKQLSFFGLIFGLGGSVLLAAATKPTALLFLVPVIAYICFQVLFDSSILFVQRIQKNLVITGTVVLGALLGLGPTALRTHQRFGVWIDTSDGLQNSSIQLQGIIGNIFRYAINNIGLPSVLGDKISEPLIHLFEASGISWTDPNFVGYGHIAGIAFGRNEDYAANPFQLVLLLLITIPVLIIGPRITKNIRPLVLIVISMFVIQATVFKWNLWTNRLIIPILLLSSVIVGFALEYFANRSGRGNSSFRKVFTSIVLVLSALYSLFFVVQNQYRPLITADSIFTNSRESTYFNALNPETRTRFIEALEEIRSLPKQSKVVIVLGGDSWEYPFWAIGNPDNQLQYLILKPTDTLETNVAGSSDLIVCVVDCPNIQNSQTKQINMN